MHSSARVYNVLQASDPRGPKWYFANREVFHASILRGIRSDSRDRSSCRTRPETTGPYKVLKTIKVGGVGGFDYVYADDVGRRLYIPRTGTPPRITAYNLDTLEPAGEIPNANARGAAVDPKSNHGFGSSKPVVMWDTKTLATIKTIDVEGGPDGILFDPFNGRVWVFSHRAPNATVINASDGSVAGTVDLGGAPEQAVTDGKGHLYVDLEDKDQIAVVDAKTLTSNRPLRPRWEGWRARRAGI